MRAHPGHAESARTLPQEGTVPKSKGAAADDLSATASNMLEGAAGILRAAIHEGARVYAHPLPVEARRATPRAREGRRRRCTRSVRAAAPLAGGGADQLREREATERQHPRGAAREDDEGERRASRVYLRGRRRDLNAGCTGHEQRPGCPEAEGREDRQSDGRARPRGRRKKSHSGGVRARMPRRARRGSARAARRREWYSNPGSDRCERSRPRAGRSRTRRGWCRAARRGHQEGKQNRQGSAPAA